MRFPRRIDLGFGRLVVRLVTKKVMAEEAEDSIDQVPDGLWDPEQDTIFVGRWLSAPRRREVLFHEVIHAVNDTAYWSAHGGE